MRECRQFIRGLERTRKFFFVLKSLVPTQSSQDKEKFSCPFQSTDNFPEWKLAFSRNINSPKKYARFANSTKFIHPEINALFCGNVCPKLLIL